MFTTAIFVLLLKLLSFQSLHATYLTVTPDDVQISREGQFLNQDNELTKKKYSFDRVENFIQKDNKTFMVSKINSTLVFSSGEKVNNSAENQGVQLNVQHINVNSSYEADQLINCVFTKEKKSNPLKIIKDLLTSDFFSCETVTPLFCQKQESQMKILFENDSNQVIKEIGECKQTILATNSMTNKCKILLGKTDLVNEESIKKLNFNENDIEQRNNQLIKAMTGSVKRFDVVNKFQYNPMKNNLALEFIKSVDLFLTSHVLCSHLNELNSKLIIKRKLGIKPEVKLPSVEPIPLNNR